MLTLEVYFKVPRDQTMAPQGAVTCIGPTVFFKTLTLVIGDGKDVRFVRLG